MDYASFYEQHLGKIKWASKGEGVAHCPFHADKTASLAVNRSKGVWFCHACNVGGSARQFAERLGVEPPPPSRGEVIATYVYQAENGRPVMRVVRTLPKRFHQERYAGGGRFVPGVKGVRLVLYHLPEVLAAVGVVAIVEGEKDADALQARGFAATTNPMGAGKWRADYAGALRGKAVCLLPDNDDPGRRHMDRVGHSLRGVAPEVKLLQLAGLPEHGDVSDWFAQGHTAEELTALIATAPTWAPARDRTEAGGGQTLAEACPGRIPEPFGAQRLPAGYTVSDAGLHNASGHLITGTPILPVGRIQDLDTRRWSYDLLLVGRAAVRPLRVAAQDLADMRRIVSLAALGVEVTSISARGLVEFLTAYLRANRLEVKTETRRLGFIRWDGGAAYVLHEVYPAAAAVQYPAETEETRQLKAGLVPLGDLPGVAALVTALLPYPIPLVTLCAAVAPAVRELLDLEAASFLFYLAGPTSSGKTVSQQIGLSAWADPFNHTWLAHGHVTYAAFEALCARFNGLPVVVEDLQLFRLDQRDELLYAIGNERFKGRGGERARIQTSWRGIVIASGERHFVGEDSAAGAGARLITLEGLPFTEVTHTQRRFLADEIIPGLRTHHGILGPAVVRHLLQASQESREQLRADFAGRRDHFGKQAGGDPILARKAPQWALLSLTGKLLGAILPLEKPEALEDAVFGEFERAREHHPTDPVEAAYEDILSWAQSQRPFFQVVRQGQPSKAPERHQCYGKIHEGQRYVAFYRNVLKNELARLGHPQIEPLLREWRTRGWLKVSGPKLSRVEWMEGGPQRMYVLGMPAETSAAEGTGIPVEVP